MCKRNGSKHTNRNHTRMLFGYFECCFDKELEMLENFAFVDANH